MIYYYNSKILEDQMDNPNKPTPMRLSALLSLLKHQYPNKEISLSGDWITIDGIQFLNLSHPDRFVDKER
jgi:hypothetical protein